MVLAMKAENVRGILFSYHSKHHHYHRTENVLEIVGLGKACEIANRDLEKNAKHMKEMRDLMVEEFTKHKDAVEFKINGDLKNCLPNTLSIGFPGTKGFDLMNLLMDKLGLSVGMK
jgi:cysteine desulfurase